MKDKKRYILSFIFFVLIFILTYVVIFKDNNLNDIIKVLKKADKDYILIGFSMGIIFFLIQGYYIKLILKYLGKSISYIKAIIYACIEFYFSGITPSSTGGQPVQVYYMKKDKVSVGKSSILVVLTTIIYKLVLIIFGISALIFKNNLILNNGKILNIMFFFGMVLEILIILGCTFFMFSRNIIHKLGIMIIKLLAKIRIVKNKEKNIIKFEKYLEEYKSGAEYIKKNLFLTIRVTVLIILQRLAIFSIGYFVYRALGLNYYTYFDIVFIQVVIALSTGSLPFPGGIGISEAILLLLYNKICGADIALSAMLITRTLNFYFILALSGIMTVINHILINKNQKVKNEIKL